MNEELTIILYGFMLLFFEYWRVIVAVVVGLVVFFVLWRLVRSENDSD